MLVYDIGNKTKMESITRHPAYEGFDMRLVQHVDMKTWAASTDEKPFIATNGLGPCIGVALYDSGSKKGWVGHFANAVLETEALHAMLTDAVSTAGEAGGLHVYVRGGQDSRRLQQRAAAGDLVIDIGAANKDTVAEALEQHGIEPSQTDTQYDERYWDDPGQEGCTRILLDTRTGDLHEWRKETGEVIQKVGSLGIAGSAQE